MISEVDSIKELIAGGQMEMAFARARTIASITGNLMKELIAIRSRYSTYKYDKYMDLTDKEQVGNQVVISFLDLLDKIEIDLRKNNAILKKQLLAFQLHLGSIDSPDFSDIPSEKSNNAWQLTLQYIEGYIDKSSPFLANWNLVYLQNRFMKKLEQGMSLRQLNEICFNMDLPIFSMKLGHRSEITHRGMLLNPKDKGLDEFFQPFKEAFPPPVPDVSKESRKDFLRKLRSKDYDVLDPNDIVLIKLRSVLIEVPNPFKDMM